MRTASFAVNLSAREIDETTLTWEHPVRLTGARVRLEADLVGEAPAWIHVSIMGGLLSWIFHPPCGAGARRVAIPGIQLPCELPARTPLKVWGIRPGTGGVFRVEIEFERASRQKAARTRQEPRGERARAEAGSW